MNFFYMLNGPIFPCLVKYFWIRVEVFHKGVATIGEIRKITENKDIKGKSRAEMGLKEFKEVEIRSAVMVIEVTISNIHIEKHIGKDNKGRYALNTKHNSPKSSVIK